MVNLYFKGDVCEYLDPINTEVEPDIKRKIRADVIDYPWYFILKPDGGNMLRIEKDYDEDDWDVSSTDMDAIGTVQVFHRTTGEADDDDCGTLILLRGLLSVPTIGMIPGVRDVATNGMVMILQIQQWLEQQGIWNREPEYDEENKRILVEIIDEKPVMRFLAAEEEMQLAADDPN